MEYLFQINSYKTRFILSFISAIIYQMSSSIVTTLGSFCVYFISYIHYKSPNTNINMQYGNINGPIIILLLSSFSPLSGLFEKKLGPKLTLILSSSIVEICLIFYYFQGNLWIFYTISIFIGIGNGLSAGVPIKNTCKYYPKKKGTINAVIISLGGIISILYSFIGEKIINPDKENIINKETNPFYPLDVANRANNYFLFAMITFPILVLISLFLFHKFIPNNDNNTKENNITLVEKNIIDNDKITNTKEIIKTFRFWRNIIIIGLMPFWAFFINSTYRAYSPIIGIDKNLVSFLSMIVNGLSSITGLIWALIYDKFGFQIIIKIMSLVCIFLSVYYIIFTDNSTLYFIGIIISTFLSRIGMMSVINPHVMQVFEFRNYLIIGGFTRLFNQSNAFLAALSSVLLSLKFKTKDDLKLPYRIVASIGAVFAIIGLVLSFYENDEKFFEKNDLKLKEDSLGVDNNRESTSSDNLDEENKEKDENKKDE